jgi:hypothetical protein
MQKSQNEATAGSLAATGIVLMFTAANKCEWNGWCGEEDNCWISAVPMKSMIFLGAMDQPKGRAN